MLWSLRRPPRRIARTTPTGNRSDGSMDRQGGIDRTTAVAARVAPDFPAMPRVALIVIATTALMTWLVQPRLVRLLEGWLYGPRRSDPRD